MTLTPFEQEITAALAAVPHDPECEELHRFACRSCGYAFDKPVQTSGQDPAALISGRATPRDDEFIDFACPRCSARYRWAKHCTCTRPQRLGQNVARALVGISKASNKTASDLITRAELGRDMPSESEKDAIVVDMLVSAIRTVRGAP